MSKKNNQITNDSCESSVNKRIKNIIESAGITQNAFASKIDVAGSVIYNIINGRNKPSFDILEKIVSTFNVNPSYILSGIGEMFLSNSEIEHMSNDGKNEGDDLSLFFTEMKKAYKIVAATNKHRENEEYSHLSHKISIINDIVEHYSLINQFISFQKISTINIDDKALVEHLKAILNTQSKLFSIINKYEPVIDQIYKDVSGFNNMNDNIYHVDDDVFESWTK